MDVYLIRHTAVDIAKGVCYGKTDVPLVNDCTIHFEEVRSKLALPPNILVFSSPASRCTHLASCFAKDVKVDERLWELNFGEWENKAWNELPQEDLSNWMENYVDQAPPGGESYLKLQERTKAFWQEHILNNKNADAALIITHGGVIRSILAFLLEIPLKNSFTLQIDYGSISQIALHNGFCTIKYINR